jgi:hypothetical protein
MFFAANHLGQKAPGNAEFLVTIHKTHDNFTALEATDLCLGSLAIAGRPGDAVKAGDQTFARMGTFTNAGGSQILDLFVMPFEATGAARILGMGTA